MRSSTRTISGCYRRPTHDYARRVLDGERHPTRCGDRHAHERNTASFHYCQRTVAATLTNNGGGRHGEEINCRNLAGMMPKKTLPGRRRWLTNPAGLYASQQLRLQSHSQANVVLLESAALPKSGSHGIFF